MMKSRADHVSTEILVASGESFRRGGPSVRLNIVSFHDHVASFHVAVVPAAEIDESLIDGGRAVKRSNPRRRPLRPNAGRRRHRIVTVQITAAKDEQTPIARDDAVKGVLIVVVPQVRQRSPRIVDRIETVKHVGNVRNLHD